jgi:hypothetical protein
MMSPCLVKSSHAGQKQPIVFTFDWADEVPRPQNNSWGGTSPRLLPLNVGQIPQYCRQIFWFSIVSSTGFIPVFTMKG